MDFVVGICAESGVLDFYRRRRDDYRVCRVMPEGEYATTRRGLFGQKRTGHHAVGGQSSNVVGVCGPPVGIGTDSPWNLFHVVTSAAQRIRSGGTAFELVLHFRVAHPSRFL